MMPCIKVAERKDASMVKASLYWTMVTLIKVILNMGEDMVSARCSNMTT